VKGIFCRDWLLVIAPVKRFNILRTFIVAVDRGNVSFSSIAFVINLER